MDGNNQVVKSENKGDQISETKTIYNTTPGEIFWKNFLAGLGRGLGGVFIYLILLLILGVVFYSFVLPKLMTLIVPYMNFFKPSGSGNAIPGNLDIQKLLGQ